LKKKTAAREDKPISEPPKKRGTGTPKRRVVRNKAAAIGRDINTAVLSGIADLKQQVWATPVQQAHLARLESLVQAAARSVEAKDGPAQRTFSVTLTKRAAYRLRDFTRLFNVSPEDAIAAMAGEQILCLDDCREFELDMGNIAVAFGEQREATALTEGQMKKGGRS
jgi:hypothetical protein